MRQTHWHLTFMTDQLPRMLDILGKYNIKITYFVESWSLAVHPTVVKNIIARGHEVAWHGYQHEPRVSLPLEEMRDKLVKSFEIAEVVGIKFATPFLHNPQLAFSLVHNFPVLLQSNLIKSEAHHKIYPNPPPTPPINKPTMASRAFFDPLTLLRLAPAISSTASLTLAWDQHWMLRIFTLPELELDSNLYLPKWFHAFFRAGLPSVLAFLSVTMTTATLNLRSESLLLKRRGSYYWYAAGAVLAAGHLLFVPAVAPRIQAIVEDETKEKSVGELRRWLRVNGIRGLTTDLGAWVCCVVAVVRTFSV
ncbi:hypothetical protein NEUTE2DRAFT_131784 [Neurospora tetrasperma FGSC 2509]|nr:hypothetical protein NEUTE2DRAFT_131784 [Neurospora tetrasperma FGSC 2509]